jgi:hypothetical protein
MNDPSVTHLQMPLREVKAIRLMIYDEEKDMTPAEIRAKHQRHSQSLYDEFGIKTVASAR